VLLQHVIQEAPSFEHIRSDFYKNILGSKVPVVTRAVNVLLYTCPRLGLSLLALHRATGAGRGGA
jgi:hypothetical protein